MNRSRRCIDHLVIAVHDLDAAGSFCERLGFQVGARNRHPWGTENRLVQFRSSFLELVGTGEDPTRIPPHRPGHFSFGAFVRDYLTRREGLAMLVLDSADARADSAAFARLGIGAYEPFFFERKGRNPEGAETHLAFTLAFAADPKLPEAGFFVCQQHYPEAFWNPAFRVHPNGATEAVSVTLGVNDVSDHAAFLADFTGIAGVQDGDGRLLFRLRDDGRLHVVPQAGTPGFTGLEIAVPDLDLLAGQLEESGIPFAATSDRVSTEGGGALGVSIAFSRAAARAQ